MKLHTASIVVRIAVVYRPPSSKVNKLTSAQFFHDFNDVLEHFSFSSGRLWIMGDFNFHVNEPSHDRLAAKFLDFLDSYNLAQHVTEPTHKRKGTLDLIITRANEDTVLNCKVEDPDLSDHYAVHCKLTLDKPTPRRVEKTYRKLRSVDMEALRRDLTTLPVFTSPATNVTDFLAQYQNNLDGLLEIHAPLKRRVVTLRPSTPCCNDDCHNSIESRLFGTA